MLLAISYCKVQTYFIWFQKAWKQSISSHEGLYIKGEGGVPRVQIMENELECLGDRKGHDGHFKAKKFMKKYYS